MSSIDEDPEDEKEKQKELTERYKPLLDWFKKETQDIVRNGKSWALDMVNFTDL